MIRRASCFALAMSLLLAASAQAKPRQYSWEINPYVGSRDYDSSLEGLSTHGVLGLRLGYNLTRSWEIELSYSLDEGNEDNVGRVGVDIQDLSLNAVINFNTGADRHEKHGRWMTTDRLVPYLTAGFGHFSTDDNGTNPDFPKGSRGGTTLNFGGELIVSRRPGATDRDAAGISGRKYSATSRLTSVCVASSRRIAPGRWIIGDGVCSDKGRPSKLWTIGIPRATITRGARTRLAPCRRAGVVRRRMFTPQTFGKSKRAWYTAKPQAGNGDPRHAAGA